MNTLTLTCISPDQGGCAARFRLEVLDPGTPRYQYEGMDGDATTRDPESFVCPFCGAAASVTEVQDG